MLKGYSIRISGRPLCVHSGSVAGLGHCAAAKADACSYTRRADALRAMRALNKVDGWAGSASIHPGPCREG